MATALHIRNYAIFQTMSRISPARSVLSSARARLLRPPCLCAPSTAGARRLCVRREKNSRELPVQKRRRQMQTDVAMGAKAALNIELVPCLSDNYAYLVYDVDKGVTGIVDPSEARPVIKALEKKGLALTHIFNTHHHYDHTGGNIELKRKYNAQVVGPKADQARIPGIDIALKEGDEWQFGGETVYVFDTPGHTKGHVCFYFPLSKAVFTGDTLFAVGCGRLFEGTPEQMWSSLSKLISLPADTRVFCGHEYTQSNVRFALTVEPDNKELQSRAQEVQELRASGMATIPSTIGQECATNPFLRPFSEELRKCLQLGSAANDVEAFAATRRAKDKF